MVERFCKLCIGRIAPFFQQLPDTLRGIFPADNLCNSGMLDVSSVGQMNTVRVIPCRYISCAEFQTMAANEDSWQNGSNLGDRFLL